MINNPEAPVGLRRASTDSNAFKKRNLKWCKNGGKTVQNHDKDFVGRVLGGNESTWDKIPEGSNTAKEWVNLFRDDDGPTVHSCYGAGKRGCNKDYGDSVTKEIKAK